MERVGVTQVKMEGHCSRGQSPQWAVVPMEEEEEEEEEYLWYGFEDFLLLLSTSQLLAYHHNKVEKISPYNRP